MKQLLTFIFVAAISFAQAQTDTSYWTSGGTLGLNGSQSTFTNWSKGGENQLALTGSVVLFAKYLKGKNAFDNLLMADLGTSKQGKQDYRKSADRLELNTKFGHQANKHWYYTALLNFSSQFTSGYDYPNDSTKTYISNFMAPGYIKLGLGMDYKPTSTFSLFLSPATARWTIVNDMELADAGKFGLTAAVRDTAGNIITHADKVRFEVGALVRLQYAKDIFTNVNFSTIIELYSNYLQNPQNIDVDWQFFMILPKIKT